MLSVFLAFSLWILIFSEFVSVSLLQLFSLSSLFPCGTYAFMLITSLHLSSHRPHRALITFAVSHSCLIDPHSFSVAEDTRKWCPVFRLVAELVWLLATGLYLVGDDDVILWTRH